MRICFVYPQCKVDHTWASSRVLEGHYLASQKQVHVAMFMLALHACRLVHGFTYAGMLPSQFINFCKFAEIGVVSNKYIQAGIDD